MKLTVEQINRDQLHDYASGVCPPYTVLNARVDFLLAEIKRIEKQTAEKCWEVASSTEDICCTECRDDIANGIRKHFTLPPPPE